jgi:hypothetical protein
MTRRFMTLASAISLLLCVATTFLWTKTWNDDFGSSKDYITLKDEGGGSWSITGWLLMSFGGRIGAGRFTGLGDRGWTDSADEARSGFGQIMAYGPVGQWHERIYNEKPLTDHLGFILSRGTLRLSHEKVTVWHTYVTLPHWALIAAFLVLPLLWINRFRINRRNSKRVLAGHCRRCNYDVRASEDRCPECGTPIVQKTQVAQ